MNATSANCSTVYLSAGNYRDKRVWVDSPDGFCPVDGHVLQPVEDENGRPTGWLLCGYCGGMADWLNGDPERGLSWQ